MKINTFILLVFALFLDCKGNTRPAELLTHNKIQETDYSYKETMPSELSLTFMGYNNNFPVFVNNPTHELYISRNTGKLELFKTYDESLLPQFINNKAVIYTQSNYIIIKYQNGEIEKRIDAKQKVTYLTINEDITIIFFEGIDHNLKQLDVGSGTIVDLHTKAFLPTIIGKHLYYSILRKKDTDDDYENLIQIDLSNIKTNRTVVEGIMGDPWFITPDEKYLVCDMYKEPRGLTTIIYNLQTNKINFIEQEGENTWGYYSYQEKAIVFYDPSTFKTRITKLDNY